MQYNVNGVTFSKEDLKSINLSEIKINTISRSYLIYLPPNEKNAFIISRAGDFVEQELIDKYRSRGLTSLYELQIANPKEIEAYKSLFIKLESLKSEKDKQIQIQAIAKKFGQDYWIESDKSFLSFALVCFEHFYMLEPKVVEKMQQTSMTLYSRAILGAAISVMNCFIHRICDPYFIKDLYNAVFIMDYGLVESDEFSYSLSNACETERNNPGQGLIYLKENKRSEKEISSFINHSLKSAEYAENFRDRFFNPEVIDIIKYHHEKTDGTGFPLGISYSAISDMETFFMFSDYMVPFGEHRFQKDDGRFIIKKSFAFLRGAEEIDNIPVQKIFSRWESFMDWAIKEDTLQEAS